MSIDEALKQVEKLKSLLEMSKKLVDEKDRNHKQELEKLSTLVESKDEELNALNTKLEESLKEKETITKEDAKIREEYTSIQEQLSKISKMYQEISTKRDEAIDVRELLSIYIVLLEEVFQGRPHAKILFLLHGDRVQLNREAITKASGVQPAIVLKSIHDLAAANLVKYDMEQQTVELVRKLY